MPGGGGAGDEEGESNTDRVGPGDFPAQAVVPFSPLRIQKSSKRTMTSSIVGKTRVAKVGGILWMTQTAS